MKCAVIDLTFPLCNKACDISGMFLRWMISQNEAELVDPINADVILVTSTDPREAIKIRAIRQKFPNTKILVGGVGAYAPIAYGQFADAVCVGEGYNAIKVLLEKGWSAMVERENIYTKEKTAISPDYDFPWHLPPIEGEDGLFRVFCGRGCKNKCRFCSTAWVQPYSEQPDPSRILRQIANLKKEKKSFGFISNDPAQHSFFNQLPRVSSSSYSVRFLKTLTNPPKLKSIRLGIEGVSERIRQKLGKPITSEDLVKCTSWLNANKIYVRWFIMTGFDFETADDWKELKKDLQAWKCITPKGTLGVSFTAFNPHPAIPMGNMPLTNAYEAYVADFREWFFKGSGWSNKIKLMFPMNHDRRVKIAQQSMCLSAKEIEAGGQYGPNRELVKYQYK